jgi:ribosome biogenesis GTPase
MSLSGRVIKSVAGDYTVDCAGTAYMCRGSGRTHMDGERIVVGDEVTINPDTLSIERIAPRRSRLTRPYVANVDMVVAVCAPGPLPDWLLVDKLMVQCRKLGIPFYVCATKCDVAEDGWARRVAAEYAPVADGVLETSVVTGEGVEALRALLKGKFSCFAGQSGMGKTSLLNALSGGDSGAVGALGARNARGKNTTRHVEAYKLEAGTYVLDTPGFSLMDLDVPPEELCLYYADMTAVGRDCFFQPCTHRRETGCAVRAAVGDGTLNRARYERYVRLYQMLAAQQQKKRGY